MSEPATKIRWRRRGTQIYVAVTLIVLLSAAIAVNRADICAVASNDPLKPACWEFWINRYQTLIALVGALGLGYFAYVQSRASEILLIVETERFLARVLDEHRKLFTRCGEAASLLVSLFPGNEFFDAWDLAKGGIVFRPKREHSRKVVEMARAIATDRDLDLLRPRSRVAAIKAQDSLLAVYNAIASFDGNKDMLFADDAEYERFGDELSREMDEHIKSIQSASNDIMDDANSLSEEIGNLSDRLIKGRKYVI